MRTEIQFENGKKQEERVHIDLNGLCNELNLRWFSYQEEVRGQKDENGKQKMRTVYFIHENGLTTGVKFVTKRDMSEHVLAFASHRASPRRRNADFISWAGVRGCRILTTMSEEARAEVRRAKAALEAMKEASSAGEMVNVEAGIAPVSQVEVTP